MWNGRASSGRRARNQGIEWSDQSGFAGPKGRCGKLLRSRIDSRTKHEHHCSSSSYGSNPGLRRWGVDKKGDKPVTHLAAAIFFTLMLLAAAVAIHMTVRLYWAQIVLALRGELGRDVRRPAHQAP